MTIPELARNDRLQIFVLAITLSDQKVIHKGRFFQLHQLLISPRSWLDVVTSGRSLVEVHSSLTRLAVPVPFFSIIERDVNGDLDI